MRSERILRVVLGALLAALLHVAARGAEAPKLENLALKARISADSEYSGSYAAKLVADGSVPGPLSKADVGKAWAVKGETHRGGAALIFKWDEETPIGEILYHGRTAWFLEECWKDYEVLLDDAEKPLVTGRFRMVHGPQRIRLPGAPAARRVELRFKSSYGGPNPGASEVQIFPRRLSAPEIARWTRASASSTALEGMPRVDRVDPARLESLISRQAALHGEEYAQHEEHLLSLNALHRGLETRGGDAPEDDDGTPQDALADLQREVLLWDVDRLLVIKRHEIVASHVYTYHYEGFRAGGGLYVVSPLGGDEEPLELVASPTGQILDVDLSHDGKVALFSWRQTQDEGYHLWTIGVDGSGLTRITEGRWHDYNACWLPDGDIAFLSTRSPQFAYCWHAPVGVVHRMRPDGTNVRRLSANYLNDFTPYPLADGKIIYTRWEYVDRPAIPIQSLWTINPDGTGLSVFFGNRVLSPGTFMEARQIPTTNRILCTMTGHNGPTRGAIGVIDPSKGVNAQEAIQNITPDVPVPRVNEGNGNTSGSKQYSGPCPLDAERFLVSARGPVLVRTLSGDCQSLALAAPVDGMQYFCAQPIRPRPRPPVLASTLEASEDPQPHAFLFLQDVYRGLAPHVKRGQIERIRVVREMEKTVRIDPSMRAFGFQFPVISCGATYAGKMVLGEVPVEEDGSAYFRVPAGMPVYFMAIDAEGRALQRMRSFTHLMPGETRSCIGCHEPRHAVPETSPGLAYRRPPRDLEPPEWGIRGFDYSRLVQPALDRYCVRCHDARKAPGGVDLSGDRTDYFNVSYDVLARENQGPRGSPYVSWIPTYNGQEQNILEVTPGTWGSPRSRLAEIVISGHPDASGAPRFEMDGTSRRRILAWIDLNVPYYGSSETAYPDREGCRRLYPHDLDRVLGEVAARRCAGCHDGGKIPRRVWTRITEPELNDFLLAPLARARGGTEKCGQAVFASPDDPDYQAVLTTFEEVLECLEQRPRMDMPGGLPAAELCRDCQ